MPQRATPLGFAAKWILVPLALLALGYFLVGPRLGGDVVQQIREKTGLESAPGPAVDISSAPEDMQRTLPEPEVDVSVRRAAYQPNIVRARREEPPKRRTRRRKPKAPPVLTRSAPEITAPLETAPAPAAVPVSDGGTSDG